MKKLQLISIFCLSYLFTNAQTYIYHPIPDSNAVWTELNENTIFTPCDIYDYYSYNMGGDTVIGSLTYKKLYKYGNKYSNCPPPGDYYNGGLKFMRQNISNKKVYLNVNGIDTLLYDFNLNIGDTLPYSYTEYGIFHRGVVTYIDSILIKSTYRKQFQISIPGDSYTIIEGVGSTIGLIPHFRSEWDLTNLQCVSINNQTVYPDTATTCTIYTGIKTNTDFLKNDFQIAPNPITNTGNISINLARTSNGKITLYNIYTSTGKIIFSGNLKNSTNKIDFDASGFNSGLYVIQFINEKEGTACSKLIEIIH